MLSDINRSDDLPQLNYLAVFDFDGTLTRKIVYPHLIKFICKLGIAPRERYREAEDLIAAYKRGSIEYRDCARKIVQTYARSIKGCHTYHLEPALTAFWDAHQHLLRPFAREMVEVVQKSSVTVAISGSPVELIRASALKFHRVYGSEFETKDHTYTGNVTKNRAFREEKRKIMDALLVFFSSENSVAAGDTLEDKVLLDKVRYPMVVHPNKELQEYAERNKIPILQWITKKELKKRLGRAVTVFDPGRIPLDYYSFNTLKGHACFSSNHFGIGKARYGYTIVDLADQ